MGQTKIALSPKELELVTDAGWILTKNAVIDKVYALFGQLSERYRVLIEANERVAPDTGIRSPKISKGEQYEQLPWVMLDYPRNFGSEDSFAIRSFFWWGNYCSITLQLSGSYQQKYAPALKQYLRDSPGDWFIGIGTNPWQHHFRPDNYLPIKEWNGDMATLPFLKIAKKISLYEWNSLDVFFEQGYGEMVGMLGGGGREK